MTIININNIKNYLKKIQTIDEDSKNDILNKIKDNKIYEETRIHTKDQYLSDNKPKDVCKKLTDLNRDVVSITQKGVAFAIWDYKNLSSNDYKNLKFIPGVEILYQDTAKRNDAGLMEVDKIKPVSELVLHAMNDDGWKAISIAISSTQTETGVCLFNDDLLMEYFGKGSVGYKNVIMTTGGLNGPISNIFKTNIIAQEGIRKRKLYIEEASGGSITKERIDALEKLIENVDLYRKELRKNRTAYNKIANKKYTTKEKRLEKYKENGDLEKYEKAKRDFDKEIEESKKASIKVEEIKNTLDKQNLRYSALKKELNELNKLIKKSLSDFEAIDLYKTEISEEYELEDKAFNKIKRFIDIFSKDNIYIEIQNHYDEQEEELYPKLIRLAKKVDLPIIATNDVYMLDNSKEEILKNSMIKSQKDYKWIELNNYDKELYFKTDEEMYETLLDIFEEDVVFEAMINTLVLTNRCNVEFAMSNHHPKYVDNTGRNSEEIFMDLIKKEIPKKFPNGLDKEHKERLNHEIQIMKDMGYIDYHLVVKDFNEYASEYDSIPFDDIENAPINRDELKKWKNEKGYNKKIGLSNGAGRGSAVGSLVCDLLNITHLDPLKYGLLFERFLNPERITMPDIDSDISRTVRPRVIKYITNKYGKECVASITTEQAQGAKGSIRAAAKCLSLYENRNNSNVDKPQSKYQNLEDKLSNSIGDLADEFDDLINAGTRKISLYEYLLQEYKKDKTACTIIKWAKLFEGVFTAYSSHAAGIVVTEGVPVSSIAPLRWNDKLKVYAVQCDKEEVENLGLLKFDLLGLKNVDIINDTLWEISKRGKIIDIYDIPLDDKNVYKEIYSRGITNSVFQFESAGMKKLLKRFKPGVFEDLIILNSMFRPGPMQFIDDLINVKNGIKEITYLTDKLKPILKNTYGVIAYQEQVMQIFQQLAGYTLGGADLVRRMMSKKQFDKLAKERQTFIYGDESRGVVGCVNNGIDPKIAGKLFDQMIEFAKYAFNKSHSAAYSFVSYLTAWLKYHYPAEFLMAALRWSEKTQIKDPLPGLVEEANKFNIKVNLPDVNRSFENFTLQEGEIHFGLSKIKNVGKEAKRIVEERKNNGPYKNIKDFFARIYVNEQAIKNLVYAGAFDSFVKNRQALLIMLPDLIKLSKEIHDAKRNIKKLSNLTDSENKINLEKENINKAIVGLDKLIFPLDIKEDLSAKLSKEKDLVGAYISSHPLDNYPDSVDLEGVDKIDELSKDTKKIIGIIIKVRESKRKSDGKPMAFLKVEDRYGVCDVNVFANSYPICSEFIKEGAVISINGYGAVDTFNASEDDKETKYVFNANNMSYLEEKRPSLLLSVSSIIKFHVYEEKELIKKYKNDKGVELFIFDNTLNIIRKMKYKVDYSIINSKYKIIANN